jgi:hypothetical protein
LRIRTNERAGAQTAATISGLEFLAEGGSISPSELAHAKRLADWNEADARPMVCERATNPFWLLADQHGQRHES